MRPVHRVLGSILAATAAYAVLAVAAPADEGSQFRPAVTSRYGVVATEAPAAARAGRAVLEHGGNAIDAAVTTVFALNAARPQSCGIGGGGFMVYRSAAGKVDSLDFRETAPAAFTPDVFQHPGLHKVYTGHLTNGVPGTLAGMNAALHRYGTYSLARALRPAIRLARHGVRVREPLATAMGANAARLKLFPAAARIYLRGGKAYKQGSVLRNPDLARTLRLIARRGPKAFYGGAIATKVLADQRSTDAAYHDAGLMTRKDLKAYRAVWRAPVTGAYRGYGITAAPPPTSGGIATIEMLNILSGYDLAGMGQSSADALHVLAEAQKLAWADRNEYVADPGFVPQPTATLTSPAYAARRRALIKMDAAAASYPPGDVGAAARRPASRDEQPGANTTSISVVDQHGNAVALTCTIEQEFGSAVVAPGTGFLLNNEMTDFGDPGTANQPQGGKRPRSSIDPVIVSKDGVPVEAIGGAGGARIIMGVTLGIVQHIDFGQDLAHAVDAERLDAPGTEPVTIENGRVDPRVLAELERRGHTLKTVGEYDILPRVQAAGIDPRTHLRSGVSDLRTDWGSYAQRHRARVRHRHH